MKKFLGLFFILFFVNAAVAQGDSNDCINAITVCGNDSFSSNVTGIGNFQEISGYCSGAEHNSIWLKINVIKSGDLGFDIIPNNPAIIIDYDFWVFGPNVTCATKGTPQRCCTTNPNLATLANSHTGIDGSNLATTGGPGAAGTGYVFWLPVLAGESYYICIDRPVGVGGFQLNWTTHLPGLPGTKIPAVDFFAAPPTANSIPDYAVCSNSPNIAIFDLDTRRILINSDSDYSAHPGYPANTGSNQIKFYNTISDATNQTNPILTDVIASPSQVIFARVTDKITGCYSLTSFNLVVNEIPGASLDFSNNPICAGDSVDIMYAGTPNAIIGYRIGGGPILTANLGPSGEFTLTVNPVADTVYTLEYVRTLDATGALVCDNPIGDSQTLVVNPLPTVSVNSSSVCSGLNTAVTATPGNPGTYSYVWNVPPALTPNPGNVASFQTSIAGTYSVIITDTTTGCSSASASGVVTIIPLPTVSVNSPSVCSGLNTTVTATPGNPGNYSYVWIVPPALTPNPGNVASFQTSIAGTYSVIITNTTTGCSSASASGIVTIIPLPTVSVNSPSVCSGLNATVTATPGSAGTYSYAWTIPSGPNPGNVASFQTSIAGAYSVIITDTSTGCASASASGVVTIIPLPSVSVNSSSVCFGLNATVTATPGSAGTYSYAWTVPPALTPNPGNVASFQTSIAGTYSVVITDASTSCSSASASGVVTINPLPIVTVNSSTVCPGDPATVKATPGTLGSYTYSWTVPPALTPNPGNIASFQTTIPGTYSVVITDTATICASLSASGTVTTVFAPVITKPSDYIVCDDNYDGVSCLFDLHSKDGEISAVPVQITYYRTLADSQSDTSPITANPYCNNLSPLAQTIYVRVVDPAAPTCASYTTLQLIVNPIPTIKPVSDYQLCDNNSPGDGIEVFTLSSKDADVLGGQTGMTVSYYLTQADAQTPTNPLPNSYTNVPPSPQTIWYSITTTATTCAAVGSLKLVVNPLPVVTVNSSTVCQGDPATVTATPSTLGSYTYSWTVPSGQNPGNVPSFQTTIAGIYTATITNTVTGCTSLSASGTVTHTLAPVITNPTPYVVCDDNNDGVSCLFDLHSKDVEISTVPGIEITYYRTFADSQTPGPPITANPYCNNNSAFTQTIYVRVVDPAAPTCASYTTLQLIVNPAPNVKIPITDYQLCDVNNPGDGIEVFTLSTKDIEIINGQPSMAVTYYLTQADAQSQSNPLPNSYTNVIPNKQTIWYNIHSTATGCTNTGSLNLVVNPLPSVLAIVSDYQLCDVTSPGDGKEVFTLSSKDSEITNGQTGVKVTYYLTQAGAQNQTPALLLPNSYTNISNPQTIWYSINNTTTKCFSVGSFKLVVNPLPLPLPLQPYAVCDTYGPSSTDGLGEFDLSTLTPKIVYQTPGAYTVTYHKTQADATSGSNPLPLIYHNTTPFVEFIYLRAQNPTTGCFSVMQVELNVDSAPVMPTLAPIVNCDTDNNTQDGCTTFNLSAQTPIILAAQSGPAANYTVTYYGSQGAASSTPPGVQIPPNNYVSCGTTTVWVRVDNIVAGCFNVGSFELQVNTPIALNTPTLLSQCDNDDKPNDLHTTFDMCSYVAAYIPAGHTFQFYFDAAHMQPIPCVYKNDINFPANQTVYLEVTNDATGCKSFRTLTLEVLPIPKPKTDPTPLVMCDINNPNDGYEIFDLTTNAAYILNSDANATLHYFASQQDAMDNVNEILNPTTANVNDNVWIRVESKFSIDSNNEHCYVLVEQPIVVNPLPLITPNVVYQECDDDTDGLTVFDLTSQAAALLSTNAPPLSNYSLAFYEDAFLNSQINPATAYTNTSNPQNIYVVATNLTTGCVSPTGLLVLTVNPKPLATAPPDFASCDYDGTNDGYYLLPLDPLVSDILTGQDPNDFTVTFYDSQADATAGSNPIVDTANYMAYTHIVWVRVEDNATGCFRLVSFDVIIEKIPEPTITTQNNSNVICVDFKTGVVVRPLLLEITNPIAGNYTYQWFEATNPTTVLSTDPTYLVDTATLDGSTRSYTVVLTSTTPLSCGATSVVFPVVQSGQAVIVGATGYTISNAFSDNQTITVTVDGYGTYAYSLDDGPRQESNVFQNVGLGTHNITVWDTEGGVANSCDPLEITEVQTIDYPHYFTPNGDGINDTWNIVGLANQPTAKIYIFDRYGKLIKQIAPDGLGWDGTYNGNEMPSTDYWFTVDYNEQDALKQFKAHFAMKR